MRAAEFMAEHQGNNLMGQEGRKVPWSAIMLLTPYCLLWDMGEAVMPFLFSACCAKYFFFFPFSTFCQWISNYFTNKLKTPMRKVLTVLWLELHMEK